MRVSMNIWLKRCLLVATFGCALFAGQLYEEDNTGAEYQHVFAGNTRVATIAPLGVKFYHGDHLGSRSVVTDTDGLEVDHIDYKPFGEINRHDAVASEEGNHFTDQYRDDETELYYYGARYYNPKIGRFITADWVVPGPGNPQALNRYDYVFNNPLNLVDPSGNIPGVHNFVSPEFLNTPAYDPFSNFGGSILNDVGLTSASLNSLLAPTSFAQRVSDFSQGFFLDGIGQAVKGAIAPQEAAQGLVDAFSNPGDVLTGLGGLLSSDRGAGQAVFLAIGLLTTKSTPAATNVDDLSRAAAIIDRGGLTVAGRSLTKHGLNARQGNSLFPQVKGNVGGINQQAQNIVDDILTAPDTTVINSYRGRFGNTIEYVSPNGQGVVYDASGKFLFLREGGL